MRRILVLIVLVLIFGVMPVYAQEATAEPDPAVVTVLPLPTVVPTAIVGALPADEFISPFGAQTLFVDDTANAQTDVDYTVIVSIAIITLGAVVSVFGGALVLQGRQLLHALPPDLKEFLVMTTDFITKKLETITEGTATPLDDVALAEFKKLVDMIKADPEEFNKMMTSYKAWYEAYSTPRSTEATPQVNE